jgi:RNA polymerase sigma factor (TIGR02999 family)
VRPTPGEVTDLLEQVNRGDDGALDRLAPIVYDELRRLAASYLNRERADHTLQATALVHEAWMRLTNQREASWESRGHFLAIAATAMRRILANHARDRGRLKRGGDAVRVPIDEALDAADERGVDLAALDEALERLAALDPRKARVVELRFYAGLTTEQAASALGVSTPTVKRDWDFARTWLMREMGGDADA